MKQLLALTLLATWAMAAAAPHRPVLLQGTVSSGGIQPLAIAGADITIYQARVGTPHALGTGTSDRNGNFSIEVESSDGILYAVARQGKSVELATVIGSEIPANITINEMTTVATAYAMAQWFKNKGIAGKPLPLQVAAGMAENLVSATTGMPSTVIQMPPNANQTNAWRSLGTLANILAACVRNSGHACTDLFALTVASKGSKPTTTLEAMVNIARNPAANVRPLFALGEAVKVYQPYLEARHGPDTPDEELRLDAFTLAVKFNATGRIDANGDEECPFGGLGNIAFDENGYAWITNNVVQGTPYSADCLIVLKPNGQPADGTGNTPDSPLFGGGILGQGFGIGFDPSGNVWSGNFGWGGVNPTDASGNPGGSVSKFSRTGVPLSPDDFGYTSGLYRVQGTVSDKRGNIWLASYGNNKVQIFPKGNPNSNFPPYIDVNTTPFDIRLDDDGSGWVTYTGTSVLSKFTLAKDKLVRQFTVPIGTAADPKGTGVDSKGNAWVAAGAANAVYAFDKLGRLLGAFIGGGIVGPWGLAVDSDDKVWIANFGGPEQADLKYRVSRLCGANPSKCPAGLELGDPITNDVGYTLPSGGDEVLLHDGNPLYFPVPLKSYKPLMRSTAVQIDMAGNLWCTNNWKPNGVIDVVKNPDLVNNPGGDGVVIFVGLAAPVMPTLYSAPPKAP